MWRGGIKCFRVLGGGGGGSTVNWATSFGVILGPQFIKENVQNENIFVVCYNLKQQIL